MASCSLYCLVSLLLLTTQLYAMEAMEAMITKVSEAKSSESLTSSQDKREVHIVYMGGVSPTTTTNDANAHLLMLSKAVGSVQAAADSILYSYRKSFNGFAAVFSRSQADIMREMDGVVSVFKSQNVQSHTTASWEYLGLNPTEGLWPVSNFGNGTIVGLIDTGIWPESSSFDDTGFGPVPAKWKGSCVKGDNFTTSNCNKKLIGAKFYLKGFEAGNGPIASPEFRSARDSAGHGTHTSSIATGRLVANASFDGVGNGTASGGAPLARIAMYKVCWYDMCNEADILAAYEDAIADGVDLLSLSLGGFPREYYHDTLAIGSFHAVQKGIIVSCSAGNSGPQTVTVSNGAPWILTVAASTINRVFQSSVEIMGPDAPYELLGIGINTFTLNSTYPLVYGGDIPADKSQNWSASSCYGDSLNPKKAFGKIIVCQDQNYGTDLTIKDLGSVGFVSISDADQSVQFGAVISTTNVDSKSGEAILKFINSTKNPVGIINPAITVFNTTPAPIIAYFSSVGPSPITSDLLKPDITAPGVDILAAWSPVVPATGEPGDNRRPDFNIISGTSMASPHVTGIAALVKSVHPDWSPAAVKSAIMTTAIPLNTSIMGNYELASGAGRINPTQAVDPGLVFNVTITDYVTFLCASGYNSSTVDLITGGKQTCTKNPPTVLDLNYPSIYVSSNLTVGFVHNITRTVTNVGPDSIVTYTPTVTAPTGVNVKVVPSSLQFSAINEEQTFSVFVVAKTNISDYKFGSITWNELGTSIDGSHSVRMVLGVGPPSPLFSVIDGVGAPSLNR